MPAPFNNVFDFIEFSNFRDQITDIMLSRVTIIAYIFIGLIFLFDCVVNYYESVITEANTVLSELIGENPIFTIFLSITSLVVIYVLVNVVFVYIKATFLKLHSGKPPFGNLVIAYKFAWQDAWAIEQVFSRTKELFPNNKLIQLYYSGFQMTGEMGVAYGVILSDNSASIDDDMRHFLFKNKFRLFHTPAIHNAVHIACPIISWLIGPTYYIALRSLYPRLLRFCEKHSLCAYPVIEIIQKDEIALIAPLAQQDAFVVEEAADLFTYAHDESGLHSLSGSCNSNSPFSSKSLSAT